MPTFDLKFLGTPLVTSQNRPLKFATRKSLALLAYLSLEQEVHPRDTLVALLYPESETRLAYAGLRNTLARLRETLHAQTDALLMERDSISFNFAATYSLDVERVNAAVAALQTGIATVPLLQDATRAVRGPFLDGLSLPDAPEFDNWVAMQRGAYQRRLDLIYDNLSLQQLESQQLVSAIETVARWINQNRLNENAYRRLMRLHFLNGDRAAALQAYEICRTLLAQELGAELTPRTLELWEQIRSSNASPITPTASAERRAAFQLPLVGRVQPHQQLAQLFVKVAAGQTHVATVAGESGMGKTRLAQEFLKWAIVEGADVLDGRAFETGEHLPFQPLIDALRDRLERENAPEDLLDDVWLAELARVLPELRERYPDLPRVAQDETTARSRLFEAIARLGQQLAARRPVVWLVDDVQWADADTFELLHYLARRWHEQRAPVLIIFLVRQEALAQDARLREYLAALARDGACAQLTLKPLSMQDIRYLVDALAREQTPFDDRTGSADDFARWLFVETQGNPFFVSETLAYLDENGTLVWRGEEDAARALDPIATLAHIRAKEQALAPAIRNVIHARLARLNRTASSLLGAAAVINRNCTFARLCQISSADESDGLNALDELLAARLLLEAADEPRPYAISHDRIRQVVYNNLGSARQKVYHRRELDALMAEHAPAAEMAFHARAAEEWESAFQHNLNAGDEAMRLYALAGAAHHYETARALLNEKKADVDNAACQHLYSRLGKAYELEYQHRKALDIYEEMQSQASARDSREMELAALVARCLILPLPFKTQDVEKARVLAEEALPLAQALGDLGSQARIEYSLARTHKYGDEQIEPAIVHFNSSAELARRAGLREQLALATLDLGVSYSLLGRLEPAKLALLEAVGIFRELNHHPNLRISLQCLAGIHMGTGEFDTALTYLEEAYQSDKVTGVPGTTFNLAVTRNVIYILQGEYDRVMDVLRPALELDETQIVAWLQAAIRLQFAWCYYDLGAYEEGLLQCRKAINNYGHINPMGHSPAFTFLALLHIRRAGLTEAEAAVRKGWENLDLQSNTYLDWWETLFILSAEAELALAKGELDRAARCVEQLLRKYDELKLRHFKPSVLYLRARVELAAGNKEEAYQTLCDALALSDEMGAHREVWEMCAALSKLEAERGNVEAAEHLRARARAEVAFIAEHAGAPELRAVFLARAEVRNISRVPQLC